MSEVQYGFTEETAEVIEMTDKFLNVTPETCINWTEPRFLVSLELVQEPGKNAFLEVVVKDSEGRIASRRYFEPKMGGHVDTAEKLDKKAAQFNRIAMNIARRYLSKTYFVPNSTSFADFCTKLIADVTATDYATKPVRCMVVYNDGGYPTLRGFSPIFEDMSVPKEESLLKVNPRFDTVARPVMPRPDAESPNSSFTDISAQAPAAQEGADDLPF